MLSNAISCGGVSRGQYQFAQANTMQDDSNKIDATRSRLRAAMPVTNKWAYFDHAAVAPLCQPAADALNAWLTDAVMEGDTSWLKWARGVAATRAAAAKLLGSQLEEVALVPNTTVGINLVAEGFPWMSGDNVVTLDDEFPTNLFPWMHLAGKGVETRRLSTDLGRVDLDRLADQCDARTRVVSVSWVDYANGCRRDLAAIGEIAHRHGALFFVDAIQGLGVFPIDVNSANIDCLAADGHKWMLGPEGAGIAYISESCLDRLHPTGVGWNSVAHAGDFSRIELDLKQSAGRYEGGSLNMAGFLALGASLELLQSLGAGNIAATLLAYTDDVCQRLVEVGAVIRSPRSERESSGIVSLEFSDRDPTVIRRHCLDQGVAINCRAGRLRISAHAYNNAEDLARLLDAIQGCKA